MKEVSFVKVLKNSKRQMKFTIPQEIVKEYGLIGGEKFKVLIDDIGGIHLQRAEA